MRGDRPLFEEGNLRHVRFTPHARGSTIGMAVSTSAATVYPACAGIDPRYICSNPTVERLPRMRGDRPVAASDSNLWIKFTPHARGSTCHLYRTDSHIPVYPACAGIDPTSSTCCAGKSSLPRMRADRPWRQVSKSCLSWFTPHARGSTACILSYSTKPEVYPACAGIDPSL